MVLVVLPLMGGGWVPGMWVRCGPGYGVVRPGLSFLCCWVCSCGRRVCFTTTLYNSRGPVLGFGPVLLCRELIDFLSGLLSILATIVHCTLPTSTIVILFAYIVSLFEGEPEIRGVTRLASRGGNTIVRVGR